MIYTIQLLETTLDKVLLAFAHNWIYLLASVLVGSLIKLFLDKDRVAGLPAGTPKRRGGARNGCGGRHTAVFVRHHGHRDRHDGIHDALGSDRGLHGFLAALLSGGHVLHCRSVRLAVRAGRIYRLHPARAGRRSGGRSAGTRRLAQEPGPPGGSSTGLGSSAPSAAPGSPIAVHPVILRVPVRSIGSRGCSWPLQPLADVRQPRRLWRSQPRVHVVAAKLPSRFNLPPGRV